MVCTDNFAVACARNPRNDFKHIVACQYYRAAFQLIPYATRKIIGSNHGYVLPLSSVFGALFMLLSDTFVRRIGFSEIPIGIINSLTGAPLFALLFLFKDELIAVRTNLSFRRYPRYHYTRKRAIFFQRECGNCAGEYVNCTAAENIAGISCFQKVYYRFNLCRYRLLVNVVQRPFLRAVLQIPQASV